MTFIRYQPYNMIRQFQNEVNRLVNDDLDNAQVPDHAYSGNHQWIPAVDVKEENDRYLISADVPGVKPEEIELTMEDGVLTIKGERKSDVGIRN